MILGHGGNVHEVSAQLGCAPSEIIDMSSNMNPLGPFPGLMAHLHDSLSALTALPQADAGNCVSAFARYYGLAEECVLAGNGSTQLIYAIPQALDVNRALIVGPTYADYTDACRMHGLDHDFFLAEAADDFVPDLERLCGAMGMVDIVFICNPNNPTGALVPESDLTGICGSFPDKLFVVDEAYMPFVNGEDHFTMAASGLPNVIVLNSMSKIFRIPGLRIGFLTAPPDITDSIRRCLMPWSVNALAQSAILYLMEQTDLIDPFIEETRAFLTAEKQFLYDHFVDVTGIRLFPSTTSYILAQLTCGQTAADVLATMLEHRVLLRNCANFVGLSDRFVRISLKKHAANALLAKTLTAAVGGNSVETQRIVV